MTYPTRTDLVAAMLNPQVSFKASELVGGSVDQIGSRVIQYSGGYTTVFPFNTKNLKKVAVRCWIAEIGDAKKRSQEISNYLSALNSSYFCEFKYIDSALLTNGSILPIVMMDWVEGKTLKEYINDNAGELPVVLPKIAANFKNMIEYFHKSNIAHGDLQHGNILVKQDGSLVVIDYDSMYIRPLEGMSDSIKGLPGYQHPSRIRNRFINRKLDYFSEVVIYLSLLAFAEEPSLWLNFYQTEDLLFSKDDFENPRSSTLITKLLYSNNIKIAELCQKLIDQLSKNDIDQLNPLEDLLVSKLDLAKEEIASKWDNQPNPPKAIKQNQPNLDHITNKF